MNTMKLHVRRWAILLIIAGVLALLLYMNYVVGFGSIISRLKQTNLYVYAAAFLTALVSILFFSLTWRSLLANLSIKIKVGQALLFAYAGMFIASLVPEPSNITGDLLSSYLVSKVTGESSGRTTAAAIGNKTLVIIITAGNLVAGLILLVFSYYLNKEILIFILIVLILLISSLAILFYISTRQKASRRLVYGVIDLLCYILRGRWDATKLRARADELLNAFHEGIQTLTARPKALIKPALFSIISWTFDVSTIFLVFTAIGYPVSADKVLIVYALTGSLQSMGISFLGLTELITSFLWNVLSIPVTVSLTATLLTRFITFWFRLLIGYGAFQYVGLKLLFNQNGNKTEQNTIGSKVT
jgi:uncharacterized protein (TIRG00374 family)